MFGHSFLFLGQVQGKFYSYNLCDLCAFALKLKHNYLFNKKLTQRRKERRDICNL